MAPKTKLDDMDLSVGKRTRLYRLLYKYGPGRGRALFLPIDQGVEHGPVDFFTNPDAADPTFQLKLAQRGGYSGIVFHVGVAAKYMKAFAGRVPLILKINGKTTVPPDNLAFSPLAASVEDAVRLGADAVGYTLYLGSPAQDRDIAQAGEVRSDCQRYGMPLIIWSYPRGEAIETKGGRDSLYAIDYAARMACEIGADMVKLNVPKLDEKHTASCPAPYNELKPSLAEAVNRIVDSAGKTLVLISGGSKMGDEDLLEKAKLCLDAGVTGLIFGRNMWQRKMDDALAITKRIKELMR